MYVDQSYCKPGVKLLDKRVIYIVHPVTQITTEKVTGIVRPTAKVASRYAGNL